MGPHRINSNRRLLLIGAALSIVSMVSVVTMISGSDKLAWPLFFLFLAVLLLINGVILAVFWFRYRKKFGIRAEIAAILWGSIVFWYWGVAPLFHYLTITMNAVQFRSMAFIFLWQVPVFGLIFIGYAVRKFKPISLSMKRDTMPIEREIAVQELYAYPASIAFAQFSLGILWFTFATVQLRMFAELPLVEGIKNIANGFALSFFLALVLYVFLDGHLAPTRNEFKKQYQKMARAPFRHIARRIFGLTILTAAGTLLLLGLLTFKSWQGIIQKQLLMRMREDAARAVLDLTAASDEKARREILMQLAQEFRRGERGRIFTLPKDTEGFETLLLEAEVKEAVLRGSSAVLLDERDESKIVAILVDASTGERLVSVVFLSEFYWVLGEPIRFFLFGVLLLIILVSIVTVAVSFLATRAFKRLTHAVRAGDSAEIGSFASGDELEEIARAIVLSMHEARDLREKLEFRVMEQTTELNRRGTELAQKHEDLEEAYVKTEALLKSIGEGVLAVDSEGRIMFMNELAAAFFEKKAEDLVGSSMFDLEMLTQEVAHASKESLTTKKRPIFRALSTGKRQSELVYQQTRSGRRIATQITSTPLVLRSDTIGAVAVLRDVTEQERVARAKTEFVSIASHQFRTPLSILRWYTEVLLSKELGSLTTQQEKFVGEIHHAARRLSSLVNTILQITKIELGSLPVENGTSVDLPALLDKIIDEHSRDIEQKNMHCTRVYDRPIPGVRVNAEILSIVFDNLISNAVRYTPPNGSVVVHVSAEDQNSDLPHGDGMPPLVQVRIADTGYGIPEEEQSLLFSRLFRASNVADKEVEGTGIGLYIVKLILDRIGGSIRFESKIDAGTTFYITIPAESG